MLREGFGFQPTKLNVCSNYGGLGDMIARLPVIKYMNEKYPHVDLTVYWHDYFLELAEYLYPSRKGLKHSKISEMPDESDVPLVDFNAKRLTSLGLHLVDHASLIVLDRLLPVTAKEYIQTQPKWSTYDLKDRPYVVLTTGFTAEVRKWPSVEVNKIAKRLKDQGYQVFFLGEVRPQSVGNNNKIQARFDEDIDFSVGKNLLGKTSLIQALEIIGSLQCVCVMGVDNGLLHLASCTKTPVIWGFTTVEHQYRMPVNWAELGHRYVQASDCYGCQSRLIGVKHDFRECMFRDRKCTTEMTAEAFLSEFDLMRRRGYV